MNAVRDKPPGKRVQHRVSIDPAMGPLYEWLCTLDLKTRTREVSYLVRLGGEVHLGTRSIGVATLGRQAAGQMPTEADVGNDSSSPDAALAAMAQWDLLRMSTPPSKPT